MPTPPVFWRSPRLRPALPHEEIEIPAPPSRPSPPGPLLQTVLPVALMVVGMVAIGFLSRSSNLGLTLVASVGMIGISGLASVITQRLQRRDFEGKAAARERKYKALLRTYEKTLVSKQTAQSVILLHKDPDPRQCLDRISGRERHLWSRSPDDDDFLTLRLGLGERSSSVTLKVPALDDVVDPDPLIEAAQEFAERFRTVPAVPVCLPLREMGGAGLTGPRVDVLSALRAIVIQIATYHSPDEVKIAAIYPAAEEADWAWLRWLPHTWSDDRQFRYLANEREAAHYLLASINSLLNQRKKLAQEKHTSQALSAPCHMVLFLAAPALTENEPILLRLLAEGATLGVYPFFLGHKVRDLPKDCRAAIHVDPDSSYLMRLDAQATDHFEPDRVARDLAADVAVAMAPIRLRKQASLTELPSSLSLLELLQVRTVDELRAEARWQGSEKPSRSLAVSIGVRGGNEPLAIDLHERAHGPNGLVAGMVGAGKSEALQTLVASLALNFHPHRVAFVLVDYKGGGMADPFVDLPHTLGVITNLQHGNLATRALTSFNVEAQRRQRLFAAAEVNHIDDYQRLYYKGQVTEPLPYLVIIVDEFAEMKTEQPEVAMEFVRIARVGRALGFRLILAMQKPAGIVDGQIEANTRFRLCLRVAQTEDSQAMLKTPDAALLTGVGRAYFQVGANEIYELFQVAWSGAPYDPSGADADDPLEITEIGLDGSRSRLYRPPRSTTPVECTQLKALTRYLAETARALDIRPLQGPWLPPLPAETVLEEVRPAEGFSSEGWTPASGWLEPVIGLYDDPRQRRQGALGINLEKEGHLVVYGAPGYGTSTLVHTLVTSLALTYSPEEVALYLLDFGGRLMRLFEPMPHVGAVITADEPERVERLLRYLRQEMERRKDAFGRAAVGSLPDYRQVTGDRLPAIVVVLDNYTGFAESDEAHEDALAQIAREGGSLGVHLVLTATSPGSIRHKVGSNFTLSAALHLSEAGEYGSAVGRLDGAPPEALPGRGLLRGTPPIEFQAALPMAGVTDADRYARLRTLAREMATAWHGPRATPIRTLPDVIALSDLLSPCEVWPAPTSDSSLAVPVGLEIVDLEPFSVDLRSGPNFLVTGPVQSGKTSLLQTWLIALATRVHPDRIRMYLLDSRRQGLAQLAGLPHVQAYACSEPDVERVVQELDDLLRRRERSSSDLRRREAGSPEGRCPDTSEPAVLVVVDDMFDRFDDTTKGPEAKDCLGRIFGVGRRLGFFMIVAASAGDVTAHGWDEPIKSLKEAQTGFMLGSSEDPVFNLRLPMAERDRILPPGQAYWARRGQSRRLQLATAQTSAGDLDRWVDLLLSRVRPDQRVTAEQTVEL